MAQDTKAENKGNRTVTITNNAIDSKELLNACRELIIHHMSEEYKLRLTGNGKLILTK